MGASTVGEEAGASPVYAERAKRADRCKTLAFPVWEGEVRPTVLAELSDRPERRANRPCKEKDDGDVRMAKIEDGLRKNAKSLPERAREAEEQWRAERSLSKGLHLW